MTYQGMYACTKVKKWRGTTNNEREVFIDDIPGGGEVDVVCDEAHPAAPVSERCVGYGDVTVAPPTRDQEAWLTLAHLARHIFLDTRSGKQIMYVKKLFFNPIWSGRFQDGKAAAW